MKITIKHIQPALNAKYFDYLKREYLTDCILIADGHKIQAHKIVLSISSTYFEQILALLPDKNPAMVLFDVPHTFLSMILELIYCGKVEVNQPDVLRFLKTLENLKILTKNVEYLDAKVKQEIFYVETECDSTGEMDIKSMMRAKENVMKVSTRPANRRKSAKEGIKHETSK